MQVNSKSPIQLEFLRGGGSIIASRLDFWSPTQTGWVLADSKLFQAVTKPIERQNPKLAVGIYTVVFTCRVEESINGIYNFEMKVNSVSVGADHGNVDTTSNPHDSKAYKNQFVLVVQ